MKKLINIVALVAMLSATVIFTGCATTGSNAGSTMAPAVVEVAAAIGTQYDLSPPPGGAGRTQDRPYFEAADLALQSLATSNVVSFAQVNTIITKLNNDPAYASYSGLASLALTDALSLIQAYVSSNTNVNSIQPYVVALDNGIQAGLQATAPASTNNVRAVKLLKLKH